MDIAVELARHLGQEAAHRFRATLHDQFDAGYHKGGFYAMFEYAHMDQQAASVIGNNITRQGLYAQISYRPIDLPNGFFQKTEYVFRYSRARFKGIDPGQLDYSVFGSTVEAPIDRDQYTVGINHYFYPSLVLKVAYEFNREAGSQSFDQHLTDLFMKQIIDVGEAKRLASNVDALNLALRGIGNSDTRLRP